MGRAGARSAVPARFDRERRRRASMTIVETFTPDERRALAPYFTDLDGPVFALVNLPEVVKGALFARYSRSAKSLRRLFLDEFLDRSARRRRARPSATRPGRSSSTSACSPTTATTRWPSSGGVHLACEGASNILTKVLEWGRLMAYLEQSTRYVPYTDRPDGRWKYHVPAELDGHPLAAALRRRPSTAPSRPTRAGSTRMRVYWSARFPRPPDESDAVYRATIRAKALDSLRGLLPAATRSNVGIFGTGQAYEALLLRMRAHPLREVRDYAELMLVELRKVIPAFLPRVERARARRRVEPLPRGDAARRRRVRRRLLAGIEPAPRAEVTLTDFDPDGEVKVVAAALYAVSRSARRPAARDRAHARAATSAPRCSTPTSARARTDATSRAAPSSAPRYRFDILGDYGAFRDLQRHRLLTLEWQPLSPRHGYVGAGGARGGGALARLGARHGGIGGAPRRARRAGLPDVAPVRRRDGLPRPLLHGDERARGDAHDRAAHDAAGPPGLPAHLPDDAPAHRRAGGPSRARGGDDLRGLLRRREAPGRARRRAPPRRRTG